MGVHPIEESLQLTDPIKGYMFDLVFENLLGKEGISGEQFELRVQSYTFPGETVDNVDFYIGCNKRTDAGLKHRHGTWSTDVIETQDTDMLNRFQSWLDLMHDLSSGTTGLSTEYKVDITVRVLDASMKPVKTRKLKRAWPYKTGDLNFNPQSKDAMRVKVDWYFDWWE